MKKLYVMPKIKELILEEDNHLLCGSNGKSEADAKTEQFEEGWE